IIFKMNVHSFGNQLRCECCCGTVISGNFFSQCFEITRKRTHSYSANADKINMCYIVQVHAGIEDLSLTVLPYIFSDARAITSPAIFSAELGSACAAAFAANDLRSCSLLRVASAVATNCADASASRTIRAAFLRTMA